jgi:hypothetical protein
VGKACDTNGKPSPKRLLLAKPRRKESKWKIKYEMAGWCGLRQRKNRRREMEESG